MELAVVFAESKLSEPSMMMMGAPTRHPIPSSQHCPYCPDCPVSLQRQDSWICSGGRAGSGWTTLSVVPSKSIDNFLSIWLPTAIVAHFSELCEALAFCYFFRISQRTVLQKDSIKNEGARPPKRYQTNRSTPGNKHHRFLFSFDRLSTRCTVLSTVLLS